MLPDPNSGGIERISYELYKELNLRGHHTYVLYESDKDRDHKLVDKRIRKICYSKDSIILESYINKWNIDILLIQDLRFAFKHIHSSVEASHRECKIIYCYHFRPGEAYRFLNIRPFIKSFGKGNIIKNIIRILFFPIYKLYIKNRFLSQIRYAYQYSNKFILLAKGYYDEMKDILRVNNPSKMGFIPNSLSYREFANSEDINKKTNKVLIVGRMVQEPKNIHKALEIWEKIESDSNFDSWSLDIIGDGADLQIFMDYANKNLSRVHFYGKCEPHNFYLESSIFLMTSKHEGWGITLTEAMQFGCVPIAFDTSEGFHEIIDHGKNGFLIPLENDVEYISSLKLLMQNDNLRRKMSIDAVSKSKKFSLENIISMWETLFMQ